MKITRLIAPDKTTYEFIFEGEKNEGIGQGAKAISVATRTFSYYLPKHIFKNIHPDLEAMMLVTVLQPWMNSAVTFPRAVSKEFAAKLQQVFGVKTINISKSLSPRKKGLVDAVSFSGGNDSVAAALLLPKKAKKITFGRTDHPHIAPRQDNTKKTVEDTVRLFNSELVKSDVEYIVSPYLQFPTWIALASPCILLADEHNLRSVAFGSIAGSSLVKNGVKYHRYDEPDKQWNDLLSAVGISIIKPVAGITEIMTAKIVRDNGLQEKATSCTIGEFNKPCMSCKKCLRKFVVNAYLEGNFDKRLMKKLESSKQVRAAMAEKNPFYFQHIFIGTMVNVSPRRLTKTFRLFRKKVLAGINIESIDWIYKLDTDALSLYVRDDEIRKIVYKNCLRYCDELSEKERLYLKNWDLEHTLETSLEHELHSEKLQKNIDRYEKTGSSMPLYLAKKVARRIKRTVLAE